MNESYKFHLRRSCLSRGWTFEDCVVGIKINGVKIDTLKELEEYIYAQCGE